MTLYADNASFQVYPKEDPVLYSLIALGRGADLRPSITIQTSSSPKWVRWAAVDEQLTFAETWAKALVSPRSPRCMDLKLSVSGQTYFMGDRPTRKSNSKQPQPATFGRERSSNWSGGIFYTPKWSPAGTIDLDD